jgi:hypothetical protein
VTKYQPLSDHLAHLKGAEWRPTFHELERMLGFDLPKAARKRASWWTDEAKAHADAWTAADWAVDHVDLGHEIVAFRRGDGETHEPARRTDGGEHEAADALVVVGGVLLTLGAAAAVLATATVLRRR